ncbi:MAG: formylglycine-generating enzyme family protein [Polyangiaceae bacterium]|nr:formylglycine-generating enzyme family protein [Polyangiaceae bacterium]
MKAGRLGLAAAWTMTVGCLSTGGLIDTLGGAAGAAAADEGEEEAAGSTDSDGLGCNGQGRSCTGGLVCGAQNTTCCESLLVEGGSYNRSPGESPAYPATVASFCLDKYEVTVGRFRRFLSDYDTWHGDQNNPRAGAGEHPSVGVGSGWDAAWDGLLPTNAEAFEDSDHLGHSSTNRYVSTWRDDEGTADAENLPINYVSWYEAFAFCLWDGGRLPTEAEWQYAAQGGNEDREYPWRGSDVGPTFAVYDCMGDEEAGCADADVLPVGSRPAGDGRWKQSDLAGSMREWILDRYTVPYPHSECNNCANLTDGLLRAHRSGAWDYGSDPLAAAYRNGGAPTGRVTSLGVRCARGPR